MQNFEILFIFLKQLFKIFLFLNNNKFFSIIISLLIITLIFLKSFIIKKFYVKQY